MNELLNELVACGGAEVEPMPIEYALGQMLQRFTKPYKPNLAYLMGLVARQDRLAGEDTLKMPRCLFNGMEYKEIN